MKFYYYCYNYYIIIIFVCERAGSAHILVSMWRLENFVEEILSFYHSVKLSI